MLPKRKRDLALEAAEDKGTSSPSLLDRIRGMEEFAALGQYLFMFGIGALKLPDFGREELETELLASQSVLVEQIQMALIKMVTTNPRLAIEQFDEQTRKQFAAMKPEMNPFGEEEIARPFEEMDLFTKIRVLHQLSVWTFISPSQMREKMGDVDPQEELSWRMDHCGYDKHGNIYYILDDNRLYRRTSPKGVASLKKKAQPKQRKGRKRRRVSVTTAEESDDNSPIAEVDQTVKWSCVCITLQEWKTFVAGLKGSKDEDEKALCEYLDKEVLPEIQKAEDLRQKKFLCLEKERQKQEAVANRKRSSRIDERMIRRKEEEEKVAETRRQEEHLRKAQAEERKREKEREVRLAARERQNKERERRLQTQGIESSSTSCDSSVSSRRASTRASTRVSQRSRRSQSKEGADWVFDCRCGVHGIQYEDGSKIIACDKCDIWQHLACQKLPPSFTEGDFTCEWCRRREAQTQAQTANSPRVTIKLRIGSQNKGLPVNLSQDQDRSTPSPSTPTALSQQKAYLQGPQKGILEESRHETSLVLAGNRNPTNAKISTTRERSAQASADFLLHMADPAHVTPNSPQQLGSETAAENISLPNSVQKSRPHAATHEGESAPQKLVPVNTPVVPSGNPNRRSPPEKNLNPNLFVENPSPAAIGSSGKDTHSNHGSSYAQNTLAGPATPAN